jgi:hypothetical protein
LLQFGVMAGLLIKCHPCVEFFERIQFLSAFVPLCYWNGAPK